MPITVPNLDNRRYQQLLDDTLARIPVHTPEWTNFNASDPGVTLVEMFAFLTENLLYRANQIPERNRKKFLQLLGLPLQSSASASGLVTISNLRGPRETVTLDRGLEVRAGPIPFHTTLGLDVLPVESLAYVKVKVTGQSPEVVAYYEQLYASYKGEAPPTKPVLYSSRPLATLGDAGFDLAGDSTDHCVWIALLAGPKDDPQAMRDAIGGKTVSLGLVPMLDAPGGERRLAPVSDGDAVKPRIFVEIPDINPAAPGLPASRLPSYRVLQTAAPPETPTVIQVTLPTADRLILWDNLEPLEKGVGNLPPTLEDTDQEDRILTWLRIRWPDSLQARILWAGINTVAIEQRARIAHELLPAGNGHPDQVVQLASAPVVPGSVRLVVTAPGADPVTWQEIEDLGLAGPEVPVPDPILPPGIELPVAEKAELNQLVNVFTLDAEAGLLRFGDGLRGRRPAAGASLRASYEFSQGRKGNVRAGAINTAPALPAGLTATNPVRTWGGCDAESAADGEKHILRHIQHVDRLVTRSDFEAIAARTPGIDLGRVEVLPTFNPQLLPNEPGDAPGAVTLMVIPKFDRVNPEAPLPTPMFLEAICRHLEPRRLVTTEVFLRGPTYVDIWISVGVNVASDQASIAEIRRNVERALRAHLSPLPPANAPDTDALVPLLTAPATPASRGWPLRTAVAQSALEAVVARVPGVVAVEGLLLAEGDDAATPKVELFALELPRIAGIAVVVGPPLDLDSFRGTTDAGATGAAAMVVPVPIIPREC
ncbi:MAG TPA: baseplate J/gp47 family protein [Lacunisphaera sp.]|nr:baseplate J/gp47 family protein [Lacunisphaera sp.]